MSKMKERIKILKSKGFDPKVILDIGAHKGTWSDMIKNIFPRSSLYLFEADACHQQLLKNKGYNFDIVLLGDENNKLTNFYRTTSSPYTTGNSIFKEKTRHYQNQNVQVIPLPMRTLDSLLLEKQINKVDFIKLDVQGAELLILEGATQALETAEVVLMEVSILEWNEGAPKFAEVIQYMNKKDFVVFDIADLHYLNQQDLFQVDLIFVKNNSKLFPNGLLS